MTKKEMIKELVEAWVRNAPNKEGREVRYVYHDTKESKLNRNWSKAGIESMMTLFNNGTDIDVLMNKYAY